MYETPELQVAGRASELIQAYVGPHTDGGGYEFSQGLFFTICGETDDESEDSE